MRACLMLSVLSLVSAVAVAAQTKESAPKKSMTPEEIRANKERIYQKTGGFIVKPGIGHLSVVNCQKVCSLASSETVRQRMQEAIRVAVKYYDNSYAFDFATVADQVRAVGGKGALFIVDDPKLPMTLYSPEQRWGLMNVAPLKKGNPSPSKLDKRFRKLYIRAFCTAFGGGASKYPISPSKAIFSVEELDAFADKDDFCVDTVMAMRQFIPRLGITEERRSTYRRACLEGWAEMPTNAVQKAIWNECSKPEAQFKKDFPGLAK